MRTAAALLAELLLGMTFVAACGASLPPVPVALFGNDPVPLPAELKGSLEQAIQPGGLQAAAGTSPLISASKAVEIAGKALLGDLAGNNVPAQDTSVPDGLVRRLFIDLGQRGARPGAQPPTSVWVVAYRWDAGFDCHSPNGGPGPCPITSFYFIDDQTGALIYGVSTG